MVLGAALAIRSAAGCNTADTVDPPVCKPGPSQMCTCAEDPFQATCRALNDRPEGGLIPPTDGGDAAPGVDAADAADAAVMDAADAADADDDGG